MYIGTKAIRRSIIRADLAIIDKNARSALYPERITALVIGTDSRLGLFSVHVLFELIEIEPDHSRITVEQFGHVVGFAPNCLLAIKHVVHLPKAALQTGGFRSQRGFARVVVIRERKVAKDNAQTRVTLFHELVNETSDIATGRALEIAELFQGNRRLRVATNVHRLRAAFSGQDFILGNS